MNKVIKLGLVLGLGLVSCEKDMIPDGTIVSIEYFPEETKVEAPAPVQQTQTTTPTVETASVEEFGEYINGPAINYPVNTIGEGNALVYQFDIFADAGTRDWNFDPSNLHGYKVGQTFMNNAIGGQYTLKQTQAPIAHIFEALPSETTIVTASANRGGEDIDANWVVETTQNLQNSNALFVRSMENIGDDGDLYSSGPVVERIFETGEGFDQSIFVGVYDTQFNIALVNQQSFNYYQENIIFVRMDKRVDNYNTTSHATPKLAAFASQLLHDNPNVTPQELKEMILDHTTTQEVEMWIGSDQYGTATSELRTIRILNY